MNLEKLVLKIVRVIISMTSHESSITYVFSHYFAKTKVDFCYSLHIKIY